MCQFFLSFLGWIEFVVGTDYLNLNGAEYKKCLIREIVDNPTRMSRLAIVKLSNEMKTKSPSWPRKGKQNLSTFFGGPP